MYNTTAELAAIVTTCLTFALAPPFPPQVMDQSVALISEAKAAVEDPNAPNKQQRLAQAAKAVSQALNQVVNCLPGQIEFDQAIKAIAEASRRLQSGKVSGGIHTSPSTEVNFAFLLFSSPLRVERATRHCKTTSVQPPQLLMSPGQRSLPRRGAPLNNRLKQLPSLLNILKSF